MLDELRLGLRELYSTDEHCSPILYKGVQALSIVQGATRPCAGGLPPEGACAMPEGSCCASASLGDPRFAAGSDIVGRWCIAASARKGVLHQIDAAACSDHQQGCRQLAAIDPGEGRIGGDIGAIARIQKGFFSL